MVYRSADFRRALEDRSAESPANYAKGPGIVFASRVRSDTTNRVAARVAFSGPPCAGNCRKIAAVRNFPATGVYRIDFNGVVFSQESLDETG
jgi:hypothetical protein